MYDEEITESMYSM